MTDFMREMINQMMGAQRAAEEGRDLPPYDHHSVCRAYLYGCCPAEVLMDTRLDSLVLCRKLHDPALKGDYERAQTKKDHFYDVETYDEMLAAIRNVDVDIKKIQDKIDRDNKDHVDSMEYVKTQKIADLNEHIGKALAQMEELGNEGKVEESMELSKTVEELKIKKEALQHDLRAASGYNSRQQLRVCEDCGAQLNLLDHETRLADHFGGKMHLGMVDIRVKFDEMKPNIEERRKQKRELMHAGMGGAGGDRDRDNRRRSPDRRDRERDRNRDSRDSRGGSDRDKRRDRSRSRDRERRRSRSRSRDRSSRSGRDSRDRRDRR